MIGKIIAMEKYFWETHVLGGIEPVPDGSDATTRYFNEKFAKTSGETVDLPEEAVEMCSEYDRITAEIKRLETEKNAKANQIKSLMKEAEIGIAGDRKISWKEVNKCGFDAKRLKAEQPDIYDKYQVTSSYRRFCVA